MNPYLILGITIAWVASMGGASWLGYDYATGQQAKEEVREQRLLESVRKANGEFADNIAVDLSAFIGTLRPQITTINNEVRHEREVHREILENPNCAVPPSVVRLLNNARGFGAGPSAGGISEGLPKVGEAGRVEADVGR